MAIGSTGMKDTGWVNLVVGARVNNVLIRTRGKEGDGALDPRFGIFLMFR